MKRIVIVAYVPEDTDIFDLHEQVTESDIDADEERLAVYENVEAFLDDWRKGSVA